MSSRARTLRAFVRMTIQSRSHIAGPAIEAMKVTEKELRRAVQVVVKSDIRHGRTRNEK